MKDYFDDSMDGSNYKLMMQILENSLPFKGLSSEDIKNVAHNERFSKQEAILAVQWCAAVCNEYINQTKGLCKGEIKEVGSRFIGVRPWRFNDFVLEREVMIEVDKKKKKESMDLKKLLLEDGKYHEKTSNVLNSFEPGRSLIYTEFMKPQHIMFYTGTGKKDLADAQAYLLGLSMPKTEKNPVSKKEESKKGYDKSVSLSKKASHINNVITDNTDATDLIVARLEFINKYALVGMYAGKMFIEEEDIKRALHDCGLSKDDAHEIERAIKRNDSFSQMFKDTDKRKYDRGRIMALSSTYLDLSSKDRATFWSEFNERF